MRSLRGTEAFERSAGERRKVEMAFAHLKRNLSFRRLRLRGITGAKDEFLLAATVQNLNDKRLAARLRYARLRHHAVVEDVDYRAPRGLDAGARHDLYEILEERYGATAGARRS